MKNNTTRFRARALATLAIAALGVTTLFSGASAEEVEPNGEQISSIRIENPNPGTSSTSQQPVEAELDSATSAPIVPVYRFWSPVTGSHFYTTDKTERDTVIKRWPKEWKYEGQKFSAFSSKPTDGVAVHRFWSPVYKTHFYTADENEKNTVLKRWPTIWKYEKVAYYAYPGNIEPYSNNTTPVFRFWGQPAGSHFYTVDPYERDIVVDRWRSSWSYEGPRFYLPAAGQPDTYPDVSRAKTDQTERMLFLINDAREQAGIPKLELSDRLNQAAANQSWYQAVIDRLTHSNPLGDLAARIRMTGFDWSAAGESILNAEFHWEMRADNVYEDWRGSTPDLALMLDPNMTHLGMAYAEHMWDSTAYWTLVIAKQR